MEPSVGRQLAGPTAGDRATQTGTIPAELYARTDLGGGFGYLPTRDGTTLSVFVTLPDPVDDGPYPTLVEYSGYSPSRPGGGVYPLRLLAPMLGYALVQVNVRGTGCSGGTFDVFSPIQARDGYDVIETVAAQDWSAKVGMFGVSYPGIMQFHVAAARPPSLAAIAPLSVLDRLDSVLHPGGIYNNGFADTWSERVTEGAEAYGQGWEQERVDGGDSECARNQEQRGDNPDLLSLVRDDPFNPLLTTRSPEALAPDIEVPVFLAGAWQDEQTGSYWPALIDDLSGAPVRRVTMYNGLHADPVAPEVLVALVEFYDIYLENPDPGGGLVTTVALTGALSQFYGTPVPVSFRQFDAADVDTVRAEYERQPPVRVLFEQGAGHAGLPVPSWEARFDTWPPSEVAPTRFGVAGGGDGLVLGPPEPVAAAEASFTTDPAEGQRTSITDLDTIWSAEPAWDWPAPSPGQALVANSEELGRDLVLVGPASADLWLSADATDAEVEVTVSEVAPDGSETYIQAGWLRLSHRNTGPDTTEVVPLIPGEPVLASVEIPPFAHVLRAGSRLRVTIDTPGASRPSWRFDVSAEPVTVTLHSAPGQASQVVLPVVGGLDPPDDRPACGSLRGQPCR